MASEIANGLAIMAPDSLVVGWGKKNINFLCFDFNFNHLFFWVGAQQGLDELDMLPLAENYRLLHLAEITDTYLSQL